MDKKLVFILAESALETIPFNNLSKDLRKSPSYRRKRRSYDVLLDATAHEDYWRSLPNREKRGRPDIIHRVLLTALGTPLYRQNHLQVYIHTFNGYIIKINQDVRPPRNYNRFIGLMEQLFVLSKVPPRGPPLMHIIDLDLKGLVNAINPSLSILFTETGRTSDLETISGNLHKTSHPMILIGGFAHGQFQTKTRELCDLEVAIYKESLSSSTVVARVLYEYEKRLDLS